MTAPWKCHKCWKENEAQLTECSYCRTPRSESQRQSLTELKRNRILSRFKTSCLVITLVLIGLSLPAGIYGAWRWHRAAEADYQERLAKDQLLDTRGTKTQCEVTSYLQKRSGSRLFCTFTVDGKQYQSFGPPPKDYKPDFKVGQGGVMTIASALITIVYDPQNPAVNQVEGDRFVRETMVGPFGFVIAVVVGVVVLGTIASFFGYIKRQVLRMWSQ